MVSDKVTPNSIKEMLDAVQADREAKKVFLAMPREEQLLAILGLIAFTNAQLAQVQRDAIHYRAEREQKEREKEAREKKLAELLDTSPDIQALSPEEKQNTVQKIIALATRPARTGALLDKVLSLIAIIVFVLFVMGKLP
jgi:hypothetical protein